MEGVYTYYMIESTRTYLNTTENASIDSLFTKVILRPYHQSSPEKTSLEILFDHCITVGPNSKLTITCDDTWTGPYLSFDSIKWNDIIYLDIKTESFLTGKAQEVLNKVIFNQRKHLVLHLYINNILHEPFASDSPSPKDAKTHEIIIQEMSKFFLNLNTEKMFENKIIYLMYIFFNDKNFSNYEYLNLLTNIQTIFYDIELWQTTKNPQGGYHHVIEKWNY